VRISLDGKRPDGEWASLNEPCGKGDGVRVAFETPFAAKELRGLHVMRDFIIVNPEGVRRVQDLDGNLLRDEPDGYTVSTATEDGPVTITFQRPPALGQRISVSVLGRRPEKGEAFKILPMTDTFAKQLDEKLPPALRKRKRDENAMLPAVQDFYREAYNRLVIDCHGFLDEDGKPLEWGEPVKKAILNTLGALLCGGFAWDRATVLQQERQAGDADENSN
jgi:hypothetical protein